MATQTINSGFEVDGTAINLMIDGEVCGSLMVVCESFLFGDYYIEKIDIDSEYRGMGFYRQLLMAAFELKSISTLRSDNRNSKSNPAYRKWTGDGSLKSKTPVHISLENNNLIFIA